MQDLQRRMEHLIASYVNGQQTTMPFVEFVSSTILFGRDYPFSGALSEKEYALLRSSIE